MHMLVASGAAYILPRVCDYLCENQNFGQGDTVPNLISCIARHIINRCVVVRGYLLDNVWPNGGCLGLYFASTYDSAWIIMLLLARFFSRLPWPIALPISIAFAFLASFPFELARKCVELILRDFQVVLPRPLRTRFLMPERIVYGVLVSMHHMSYACAALFLSFVFHELKSITIEYLFLVLLTSYLSLSFILMSHDFWIARMLLAVEAEGGAYF